MSQMLAVAVSSLLPAAIAGICGGLGLTAFFAGRSYWWRGENLDILGYRVKQAEEAATYSIGSSLLNLSLGVFVITWLVWVCVRWNEARASVVNHPTTAVPHAEPGDTADGGRDPGSS